MQSNLQDICNFFGLGGVKSFEKAGGSNDNFFVSTETGEYLIKLFSKDRDLNALYQEQEFLQRLTEGDFKFMPYLRSKNGDLILKHENFIALAQEKVNAIAPELLTLHMVAQLGAQLAKLHLIPYQGLPNKKSWLQRGDLDSGIKILKEKYSEIEGVKKLITISERLNIDWSKFPQAIIHADLFIDNTLFHGEELVLIIDWEEVTINAAVLDFAMGVVGCCFPDEKFDLELYSAFYSAYNNIRPFNTEEVGVLTQAVRFAGLTRAVWKFLYNNHFKKEKQLDEGYKLFWKEGLDEWVAPSIAA